MRRLAFIDALTGATFFLLLTSLGTYAGAVWTPKAYATTTYEQSCQSPVSCPGTGGSCSGCVAGGQSGNCSTSTFSWWTCDTDLNYCVGTITGEQTSCNCATSGC